MSQMKCNCEYLKVNCFGKDFLNVIQNNSRISLGGNIWPKGQIANQMRYYYPKNEGFINVTRGRVILSRNVFLVIKVVNE